MAVKLAELYPGRATAADANYPYGSFKNATSDESNDGTPVDNGWGNDIAGFLQALLTKAGVVPSGAPDTAQSSQYLRAMESIMWRAGDSKFCHHTVVDPGWLEADGKTVGDGASGASARANADTEALFTRLWSNPAASNKLYTAAGAEVARGGSAAADFAAQRRIALPDMRGVSARGWDHGRGLDAGRAFGSYQADAVGPHTHPATTPAAATDSQSGGDTHNYGALGASGQNAGPGETRVKNVAGMYVIKY